GALRRVAGAEVRRNDRADQCIFRDLAVVGQVERDATAEPSRVEAALELVGTLGPQVLISQRRQDNAWLIDGGHVRGRRREESDRVRRPRLHTRRSVGETAAKLVEE